MRKLLLAIICAAVMLVFGACGAEDELLSVIKEIPGQARDDNLGGRDDSLGGEYDNLGGGDDNPSSVIAGPDPQSPDNIIIAQPSANAVFINGEQVAMRVFDIGGDDFVRLQDLSLVLSGTQGQFGLSIPDWHADVSITPTSWPFQRYRPREGVMAQPAGAASIAAPMEVDVRMVNAMFSLPGYVIDDDSYFALRDLAYYLSLDVYWEDSAIDINTHEPFVSEYGRQVAEDFLAQFLSIFSFGDRSLGPDSGALVYSYLDSGVHPPDTFVFYYDREGNPLYDEVFLHNGAFAWEFGLYDFDNNGIPTITVRFGFPEHGGGFSFLFRNINGEFVQMDSPIAIFNQAFWTEDGRKVWFRDDEYSGLNVGYFFAEFVGNQVVVEEIDITSPWDYQDEWWQFHGMGLDFMINPTIFDTDIALTRIPRMIALQNEITANIMKRLGLAQ